MENNFSNSNDDLGIGQKGESVKSEYINTDDIDYIGTKVKLKIIRRNQEDIIKEILVKGMF